MQIIPTEISGCFLIELKLLSDNRGSFTKTYNNTIYNKLGIDIASLEEYYSISNAGVIRGMHFQTPPDDHIKIVHCSSGHVKDIVFDMRKNSETFGKSLGFDLTPIDPFLVVIPKGCAHGFYSYENNSIINYKVSSEYSPQNDKGILWNSIDFNWPTNEPILSIRDNQLPSFLEFETPF